MMGRKNKLSGLIRRGDYWHIDKRIFGRRIRCSTGTKSEAEAEAILAKEIEATRQAVIFGVRPKRLFKEAMVKYLQENQHKDSIETDVSRVRTVVPYVADMPLDRIHMGSLQTFINTRKREGRKMRTINHGLKIIRRILNLAASEWMDEHGLTWLATAPKIKLLPEYDIRPPYPLSVDEEQRLLSLLPTHLRHMAKYAMYTGSRDKEVYNLRWQWEIVVPCLQSRVFILPAFIHKNGQRFCLVKNGRDRLVVLNRVAQSVIEEVRGQHPEFVFTYRGKPVTRMNNSAWCRVRELIGLPDLHVHDLKHTYGRRLRQAGVSFEDRQDLLGHKSSRMTTHYSQAEIKQLWIAANKACEQKESSLTLRACRLMQGRNAHNLSTMDEC